MTHSIKHSHAGAQTMRKSKKCFGESKGYNNPQLHSYHQPLVRVGYGTGGMRGGLGGLQAGTLG